MIAPRRPSRAASASPPAAEPPPSPVADTDGAEPRYLRIAAGLRRAIADGTYPVGARLPTELELCSRHGISRFTAREAVRVLSAAGLVTRRQRVGTVVVATPDESRYRHDVSSMRDLLQYATDTQLRLVYVGRVALAAAQAEEFGAAVGDEWIYAFGLRVEGPDGGTAAAGPQAGRPIGITRLFLNPVLDGIEQRLRQRDGAVYSLIEQHYGIEIRRVEQELQGVLLDADDAANLGAAAGAPALRIVRRYYAAHDRLLEVSENIHPSDRFTYRMQLHK